MAGGIVPPNYTPPSPVGLPTLLQWILGMDSTGAAGVPAPAPVPAPVPVPAPAATVAPEPAPAPVPTTTPGTSTLPAPIPRMRPEGLLGMLMGPSAPPSQEGAMYAPSQGPGEAVTQPDPAATRPSILDALRAPAGAGADASAPRAPAPPGPRSLPPGLLLRLLGGQNPMAQSRDVNLPLLSKLLGGR